MNAVGFDWDSKAPLTERLWSCFDESAFAEIRVADRRDLADMGVTQNFDASPFSLRGGMRSLELMIDRMAHGWHPSGYYLIDEYANDMHTRDRVGEVILRLPLHLGREIREVLDALDGRLWDLTVPDLDNQVVSQYFPERDASRMAWWWHRIPSPVPWAGR